MKILNVVGARPNFIKIAPLLKEMRKFPEIKSRLIHTGQHYDKELSENFFKDLNIRRPDHHLGVGSGTQAVQTAKIMKKFQEVCDKEKPDLVVVVGDVTSTLACALVAIKNHIPVAHIEAGLRSLDKTMPEEVNRVVTDSISSMLFTPSYDADQNLIKEGAPKEKIHMVGNIMIDTLLSFKKKARQSKVKSRLDIRRGKYALLTLHRPSNVDEKKTFINILDALEKIQRSIKIIFPVHPRTLNRISAFKLQRRFRKMKNFILTKPLSYLDFMNLLSDAKLVLTDSGGIQEETTILGVPCLTLRNNTERPVTIKSGTNIIVGCQTRKIVREAKKILRINKVPRKIPRNWDGKAAQRIVKIMLNQYHEGKIIL